jgi:hypothetical protein
LDKCLADVAASDLYVGIFAWRYGYMPPPEQGNTEGRSITELEYRKAGEVGIQRLVFLLNETVGWPRCWMDDVTGEGEQGARIKELRKGLGTDEMVSFFENPDHLASLVGPAVAIWQAQHSPQPSPLAGSSEEAGSGAATPLPREVIYHAYVAFGGMDVDLANALASGLASGGRRSLLSPDALFAQDKEGFFALERQVCLCHGAAVILSDALLSQLEPRREEVKAVLEVLKSRTGRLVAVCRSEASLQWAVSWGFDTLIDASGTSSGGGPVSLGVIVQLSDAIAADLPQDSMRAVGLPFVVVAMTHDEAEDLVQRGEVLIREELGSRRAELFHSLVDALIRNLGLDLTAHARRYGTARAGWRPFLGNNRTIVETILDVVTRLNDATPLRQRGRAIKAQFYSFDPLMLWQEGPQYGLYREIARTGCVVVVDELSMLHPAMLDAFEQSPLKNSLQAALVTISPFDPYGLGPEDMIEAAVRRQLGDAVSRFGEDFDPRCEFGIGSEHRLKRWLVSSLPGTLDALLNPPMDPSKKDRFTREVCQQPRPNAPALLEGGAP